MNELPTVISLNGYRDVYGPRLERAGSEIVYIGRAWNKGGWQLPQSIWHNPFTVKGCTREQVIEMYRQYVLDNKELVNSLPLLRGKVLACWCRPKSCHGDVLIELYREQYQSQ